MSEERKLTFMGAINEAIDQSMEQDDNVILIGTDVSGGAGVEHIKDDDTFGGVFGVTKGLAKKYSRDRVIDTPIAEHITLSSAVGAAATGMLPIAELMFNDFIGFGLDPILNQGAKMRYMFGGKAKIPLVVRTVHGAGVGAAAQHSQSLYNMFATIPGVKVVVPSNPYDAKGLLMAAVQDDNLVVFSEDKTLLGQKGDVPEEPYTIEIGKAKVTREGDDLTIVAIGKMVAVAEQTADKLKEDNVSVEVIDLRSVSPWDKETVLESVKKTGRLIVIDESNPQCNVAGDVASVIGDIGFDYLDGPIKKVTAPDTPVPFAANLEQAYIPNVDKVLDVASELIEDLKKVNS
ncbi:alpha-ketoacid dehydrogenase subunit beta [Staphylococcus cohnii]|uniref:alpha-ketoacid dehydrogenase subunit beta n=1 Tax=Staphylococcus cohnii TaxID=29382 RepID=UPI00186792DB|nr:alpha-ketoacid dehydrogenase subunit beta [Staphylococcus cohnii]